MSSAFTILQPSKLPCSSCTAECCTAIPLFPYEWKAAIQLLKSKSRTEIERLAGQKREDINRCMFVDMRDHTCSIHAVRPTLCRLFGLHPNGLCTHAPEAANTMTQQEADAQMSGAIIGQPIGLTGITLYEHVAAYSRKVLTWQHVLAELDAAPTSPIPSPPGASRSTGRSQSAAPDQSPACIPSKP